MHLKNIKLFIACEVHEKEKGTGTCNIMIDGACSKKTKVFKAGSKNQVQKSDWINSDH